MFLDRKNERFSMYHTEIMSQTADPKPPTFVRRVAWTAWPGLFLLAGSDARHSGGRSQVVPAQMRTMVLEDLPTKLGYFWGKCR